MARVNTLPKVGQTGYCHPVYLKYFNVVCAVYYSRPVSVIST